MPKSRNKVECPACGRILSASAFIRHCRAQKDEAHAQIISELESRARERRQELEKATCKNCGKPMKGHIPEKMLNRVFMELYLPDKARALKIYCSKSCQFAGDVWNKGLTKHDHPSIQRLSEARKGEGNPIHKVLSDKDRYDEWCKNVSKGMKGSERFQARVGKTYEELYGEERASTVKQKLSSAFYKAAEVRGHYPNQGKRHTPEARAKISSSVARSISEGRVPKTSKPQAELFNLLESRYPGLQWILEHPVGCFSIDIAAPSMRLCIEVDGDFWHANEAAGYPAIYESQKRTLKNDKRKNAFLKQEGWTLLRFWVSDIERDPEEVLNIVGETIGRI